ncbi:acyltransferase family protein [Stenotrophomonas sp. Iso1]|uniref:acyltransferase family protein n=1 Tax=Stenotrophomonas sp. Iso1 TaxID=2977283 RepID=UPI0022B7C8D4|nr:acyltransferase family protein [Stenotrophomonas sp. Iso1]
MQQMTTKGSRSLSVDLLKFALAFFVVAIHAHFLQDLDHSIGYILVNGIFRIAVPVFLIINGYYLFDILERGLFTPWLKRILLLYAFWMTAYLPLWAFDQNARAAVLVHRLIFGFHHLWYIAGMIGGGLCLYMISGVNSAVGTGIAIAAFSVGVMIQYIGAYDIFSPPADTFLSYNWSHRNFLLLAFPFMYAGMCIRKFNLANAISKRTTLLACAFGLIGLSIECTINLHFNVGTDGFDNLLLLALICPAIVLLALRSTRKYSGKSFSALSSGIYFTHPAVIYLLAPTLFSSVSLFLVTSAISVLAALLLTRINRQFPYLL